MEIKNMPRLVLCFFMLTCFACREMLTLWVRTLMSGAAVTS